MQVAPETARASSKGGTARKAMGRTMSALTLAAAVAPGTALSEDHIIAGGQTVNVTNKTWMVDGDLFVGQSGEGTLIIGEGGVVENINGYIGPLHRSSGTVSVQGQGARWINAGRLNIGGNNGGTLTIGAGGVVESATGYIASTMTVDGPRSTGVVTVDGQGAQWIIAGSLGVGGHGHGTLTLSNDGRATASLLRMGATSGASGRLIIGADAGQTPVAPGILGVDHIETGEGDARIVLNHTDTSGNYTLSPDVTDNVELAHYRGATRLTGQNSYTGGTVFDGGTLVLGSDNALGAGGLTVTGAFQEGRPTLRSGQSSATLSNDIVFARTAGKPYAAYLSIDGANDLELAGALSGSGHLWKRGSGTLTLSRDNSAFTGTIELSGGTLRLAQSNAAGQPSIWIDGSSSTLDYANNINLTNGLEIHSASFNLHVEEGALATQSGGVYFAGYDSAFTKTGSGTLRLTGNSSGNPSDRSAVLNQGVLLVDGLFPVSFTVNNGATLGGSGTVGTSTVADGGILAPGGSIGTLTVHGDLSLSSGSILNYELGSPGVSGKPTAGVSDRIDVTNSLTLDGTLNLSQSSDSSDGTVGLGYYRLMTYGGELTDNGLTLGDVPSLNTGYEIQAGDNRVDLFVGMAGDDTLQHWQGGDAVWNNTTAQWLNKDGDVPAAWAGNHAVFKNRPGGFDGGAIDVEGVQRFAGLQFVDEGYRLQGAGALETIAGGGSEIRVLAERAEIATQITGTGGITKTEAGTLVLSGNNTYAGGTTLAGGVVSVSSDANLGHADGALTFEGGVLQVTGSDFNETERQIVWGTRGGGFDITHGSNSFLISQDMVGGGDLVKRGEGALRLSGHNAYGNTLVEGGWLFGDTDSISGDIGNAGRVTFDQTTDGIFAGDIGGLYGTDGIMIKQGVGTLSLDGISSLDWAVAEGGLTTEAARFSGDVVALGTDAQLTFTDAGDAVYDGKISGNGNFSIDGAGTVLLTGDSLGFAGRTAIRAGALRVGDAEGNGSLGGSLDVQAGATLSGSGTVGSGAGSQIAIASGGTLAPGNSIGTLTIDGDLTFEPGSRFQVEVNPQGTDSDQVAVTGNATLQGGSVAHVGANGNYDLRSTYTILTAGGALSGVFDEVSSDFAFLTPDLTYDYGAGTVDLELSRNQREFASAALTRNQTATAKGIESIGLTAGHAVYDAIAQLPGDTRLIRSSFDALSGEIHASAKTALIEDGRFIRNAANDRVRAAFAAPGASKAPVSAYGGGSVSATHGGPVVWSQAFGSWGKTDGDGNVASLERNTGGMLIGADRLVGDWRVGVLAGYSHSDFKARERASSGKSDNYHLGVYGGTRWNALGLRTGLAHTWHDIDTRRSVAVPDLNGSPGARYNAGTFQAFGELGYGINAGAVRLEPFANLAHVRLHTDSYSENGDATALAARSQNTEVTFATLGLRAEHTLSAGAKEAAVRGMVGWRHAFGDTTPAATHGFSAGEAFTVAGVPIAKDSAVLEAGVDVSLTPSATFGFSYAGQLAGSARNHGVRAELAIRF